MTRALRSAAGLLSAGQDLLSSAGETTALLNSYNSGSSCRKVYFGWRRLTVCVFGVGCQVHWGIVIPVVTMKALSPLTFSLSCAAAVLV